MKKISCILIAFILFNSHLLAQKKYDTSKFCLRFSPAALVDIYQPNFTFGGEYMLTNKQAIGLDCSVLLNVMAANNDYHTGFIIKPTYKFYSTKSKEEFIELDCFWKKTFTPQNRWVGQDYQNGFPTYYQNENYTLIKSVFGINGKIGLRYKCFKGLFYLEPYIGFGIRIITQKIKESPDEIIETNTTIGGKIQTTKPYWGVSFPLGARVVFPLK